MDGQQTRLSYTLSRTRRVIYMDGQQTCLSYTLSRTRTRRVRETSLSSTWTVNRLVSRIYCLVHGVLRGFPIIIFFI
jgi:hypothetical protein